ncbi:ribosomal protein L6 (mitochondrion) [Bryopsis sp. KO-2023]|nr:ribosomal protein L6 [Bryopsis sp. KO-2023]
MQVAGSVITPRRCREVVEPTRSLWFANSSRLGLGRVSCSLREQGERRRRSQGGQLAPSLRSGAQTKKDTRALRVAARHPRGSRANTASALPPRRDSIEKPPSRPGGARPNTANSIICLSSSQSFLGLISAVVKNKLHGVSRGFLVYIRLLGTGYRVTKESMLYPSYGIAEILNFKVGYNHDTKFQLYTTSGDHEQGKFTDSTDPGSWVRPLGARKRQELFFRRRNVRPQERVRALSATAAPSGGRQNDKLQAFEPMERGLLCARESVYPPIRAFCIKPTLICLYGIDKNQVTQVAAQIRKIRPPSAYTGKGIFVVDPSGL